MAGQGRAARASNAMAARVAAPAPARARLVMSMRSLPPKSDRVTVQPDLRVREGITEAGIADQLVGPRAAARLLAPERLEEVRASVIDRRQDHAERRREHIAELNKRAVEAEL